MKYDIECLAVLFLILRCCSTQEPQEKRCVAGYELSFFYGSAKKINEKVREACKNYGGSRLVKVDSPNITAAIDSVLKVGVTEYYIDGRPDRQRRWTWSDGSKIYLAGEDGYQNWESGQPNNVGGNENCIIVGRRTKKWLDSICSDRLGYICQKDLDPCIAVDSSIPNIHKCVAIGSTEPQVEWRKDDNAVTTNPYQTIYQTNYPNNATLYSENATVGDAGEYVCSAWVGVNVTEEYSKPQIIKVNGTPSIIDVKSSLCNSSLLVSWEPKRTALGFRHRIIASDSDSFAPVFDVSLFPTEHVEQFTKITGLQSKTEYNIRISACVKNESCTTDHVVIVNASTNGTSRTVTKATLVQFDENKTCNVSWDWSYGHTKDTVTLFKIIMNHDPKVVHVNATQDGPYLYSFEPLQRQSYQVKVQSMESIELCEEVKAIGSCVGKDAVERHDSLKIIIPVAAIGGLLLLVVAVTIIKRRQKFPKENTKYKITTNAEDSREEIPDQESQDVYSMATEAKVSIAPPSVAAFAVVNINRDECGQEYSVVADRQVPLNDTYDVLHSNNHQNIASPSTSGGVYGVLNDASGPANEVYSSIPSNDVPGTSTYDTLHGELIISGANRPEHESQPVYSVCER